MAKKRGYQDAKVGSKSSWMVTFSDLATLLLTFFVLLLSMSSLDDKAFRSAFHNFNSSTGILLFKESDQIRLAKDMVIQEICKSLESIHMLDIRDIDENTQGQVGSDKEFRILVSSGSGVWLNKGKEDTRFSFIFSDKLLFESGSSVLSWRAYSVLERLAEFLHSSDYRAYIDGHTDSVPIHNEYFASNDELSLARAHAVLDYLLFEGKVGPEKLALGGYGSSHPLRENTTDGDRAMNRRVEIIFEKMN
jgi:chemotaxis protein MotB